MTRTEGFLPEFSAASALEHARAGCLEHWIYTYLETGAWANLGLRDGLQQQPRWWLGPVELPLTQLHRCCGPEPEMEYRVSPESWEERVTRIAAYLTTPLTVAPLIVEYRAGQLSVRDGNHRYGAMQRRGWQRAWVVVWHNSQADLQESRRALEKHLDEG